MLTSDATDLSGPTYQEAMAAAPERDRAYATELGGQMIGLVKLFGALRAKMSSTPDADPWTVPLLGKIGPNAPSASPNGNNAGLNASCEMP